MSKLRKLLIVFLVTFLSLEITSRVIFERPWIHGYSDDEFTGTSLTPGSNGWWTREGRGFVEINSRGMRDNREYENFPKSNTYRVAVVGDSYVEALQVDVNQTFWRLMESRLNSQCNNLRYREFEVLPFGVSGHGPAQYLLNIKHKISKLHPNLILVAFTPGNDFRNSIESLENDVFRPYLVENSESKKLYMWDFSFRSETFRPSVISTLWQITEKSHFFVLSLEVILRIRTAIQGTRRMIETSGHNGEKLTNLGDEYMFLPYEKLPQEWKKSRRVVEEIVSRIAKMNEQNHRIIGVVGTSGQQVHPSIDNRDKLAKKLGVNNLEEPSKFFGRIMQDNGIESIDLLPELSRISAEKEIGMHGQSPNWGGHWNLNGHIEVAKILSKKVCDSIKSLDK